MYSSRVFNVDRVELFLNKSIPKSLWNFKKLPISTRHYGHRDMAQRNNNEQNASSRGSLLPTPLFFQEAGHAPFSDRQQKHPIRVAQGGGFLVTRGQYAPVSKNNTYPSLIYKMRISPTPGPCLRLAAPHHPTSATPPAPQHNQQACLC